MVTGLELEAVSELLWGAQAVAPKVLRWHEKASEFLKVNLRTIQRWQYDETYDIPEGVERELLSEVRRRSLDIVERQEMEGVLAETEAKASAQRKALETV